MNAVLSILEFLFEAVIGITDLCCHWRFSICLLIGVGLAIWAKSSIAHETLGGTVAAVVLIAFLLIGWRWESTA